MPKVFRKNRIQVLKDNRFTKYLIYATGEIILVVFGILITFQINDRGKKRKQALEEERLLISSIEDFKESKIRIK